MSTRATNIDADFVQCDACAKPLPRVDSHTDENGFTGCRPCFPAAGAPKGSEQFLEGPCAAYPS